MLKVHKTDHSVVIKQITITTKNGIIQCGPKSKSLPGYM